MTHIYHAKSLNAVELYAICKEAVTAGENTAASLAGNLPGAMREAFKEIGRKAALDAIELVYARLYPIGVEAE